MKPGHKKKKTRFPFKTPIDFLWMGMGGWGWGSYYVGSIPNTKSHESRQLVDYFIRKKW